MEEDEPFISSSHEEEESFIHSTIENSTLESIQVLFNKYALSVRKRDPHSRYGRAIQEYLFYQEEGEDFSVTKGEEGP